jgi:hypothetical protein
LITARVISTFIARGKTIGVGRIIKVAEADLPKLSGLVEVLSPAELLMQQQSTDWRQFCDSHENDLPDSYCKLKRDRCRDPFTTCTGWELKTKH